MVAAVPFQHNADYFEIFSLPRAFHLDEAALRTRYFQLSQQFHPDKFFNESSQTLDEATSRFALISKAYETLRLPLDRAQYLVSLELGTREKAAAKLPPALAMEYFELQEELEGADKDKAKSLASSFLQRIGQEMTQARATIDKSFKAWEKQSSKDDLVKIAADLDYLSYLSSMSRDLESRWIK